MAATHLTLAELAVLVDVGAVDEDLSAVSGASVVVVHGDGEPLHDRLVAATRALPCVLVGTGAEGASLAALVDVVVADDDELDAVVDQVERTPLAAAAFALLLRAMPARTIAEGLVAESTTYSMLQAGPEFAAWRAGRPVRHRDEPPGDAVLTERDGDVLHVVLNRPHVHNALDARLRDGLAAAFTIVRADPTIERVVLRGNGRSFCSGGDLDEFGSFPDPAVAHTARLSRSAGHAVHLLSRRLEAHLHGACIGAGIEIPAFAGCVVAEPDTTISLPELGLGLVPGAGGTVSLPRRIGRHRTAWLALTGDPIDAWTARDWGLVDEISSPR